MKGQVEPMTMTTPLRRVRVVRGATPRSPLTVTVAFTTDTLESIRSAPGKVTSMLIVVGARGRSLAGRGEDGRTCNDPGAAHATHAALRGLWRDSSEGWAVGRGECRRRREPRNS